MSLYLDTSVLVAACAAEPASDRVHDWLLENGAKILAISPWVETEFAAAVSMKVRLGRYSAAQAAEVARIWQTMRKTQLGMMPIAAEHFGQAADLARQHELKLRAGDALHLAIAMDTAEAIITLDNDLLAAAGMVGFEARSP